MDLETLYGTGLALVFVGVIILVIATVLLLVSGIRSRGRVKGAGVVIIGPVPIIFGTDKQSIKLVLSLSITLVALLIVLMLVGHYII